MTVQPEVAEVLVVPEGARVDRAAAPAAVRVEGVSQRFERDRPAVLDGVNLTVAAGEFVCLVGASGCGKSTLLNLIAGLGEPTAGRIEVSAKRPALMFQEPALLPWLTAVRNVELPLRLSGVGRAARRATAMELLELVRLDGQAGKRPHELSGGMRQRVALARALAATTVGEADGRLMLMDEPFAALDAITRDVLQGELARVWRATGTAVVFVTHDVREAVRLGQRVVLLSSRPGTVVREWDLTGAPDRAALTGEITDHLREVISTHGRAA